MSLKNPLAFLQNFIDTIKINNRGNGWWSGVDLAPPDPIFGVTEAFLKDENPNKIDVGVGAYRTLDGGPLIMGSVRKAERYLVDQQLHHEYPPVEGYPDFSRAAVELIFGECGKCSDIVKDGLNATVQTLSVTGALSLGALFLRDFFPGNKVIYLPNPTFGNHESLFKYNGLEPKFYTYYNDKKLWLDFPAMMNDIKAMPEKSIILFHTCGHNPTGIDPTKLEWKEISKTVKNKQLLAFFDFAYQGFASADLEQDSFPLNQFFKDGNRFLVAQGFSANMGLYGERIGSLTVVTDSQEESERVVSQLKQIIINTYSVPPVHGARVATMVLCDDDLRGEWLYELAEIADRTLKIRQRLTKLLMKSNSSRSWGHLCKQSGMFGFTGLSSEEVNNIIKRHAVYMTQDGRINISGVTMDNVQYLAHAISDVAK